jgi:hypothetical protein
MKTRTRTLAWLSIAGLLSLGTTNQPPPYCVEKTSVPRPELPKSPRERDLPRIPGQDGSELPPPDAPRPER